VVTTLESLLLEAGVPFKRAGENHHVTNGWIGVDCPWCGTHGKFHLGLHPASGRAYCWVCGPKRLREVVGKLTGRWDVRFRSPRQTAHVRRTREAKVPRAVGPLLPQHRAYVRRRGLDDRVLERDWGVRGIGLAHRLSWRLWIPVVQGGRLVSWVTRSISDSAGKRYVAAPSDQGIPIKQTLYGLDYAGPVVFVVEGPFDVWALGYGAVATFGVQVTSRQAAMIAKFPVRVIVFDRDRDGRRAALELSRLLSPVAGETYLVTLDSGDDPASADPEELLELRSKFGGPCHVRNSGFARLQSAGER